MGGDCIGSDLVQISTGYDFVKMVIDVAVGIEPVFEKVTKPKVASIKFIFNEKDMQDYERVKSQMPNIIYRTSEIEQIGTHQVVDSSTRYGFYIMATDTIEEIGWLFDGEFKE